MAEAPKTSQEFLRVVQQSGLVPEKELREFFNARMLPPFATPAADLLVDGGLLTRFQATQLLQGRHKGFIVGRYRILDLLGAGAMGRVYLAEHFFMRRQVALKLLPKTKANTEGSLVDRFHREARAIAALNHPNVVQAYDFDQAEGVLYIAMEYVQGASLQEWVQRHGPMPWPQAADVGAQAAGGLQHALEVGIVHRDIKPANLLLERTGTIKILDMGLARIYTESLGDNGQPLSLAYNERVLGTADYLAPEQARDSHTVDIRADIYSLGCTLYYIATGSLMFPEGSVAQKLLWHQRDYATPIENLNPSLPPGLVQVINKMLRKAPEERQQTPEEVRQDLKPFVANVKAIFDSGSLAGGSNVNRAVGLASNQSTSTTKA
jgi:eukaryotic-like serine/threonine-protein kinase